MSDHRISLADIKAAHKQFAAIEPRGVFYRAATELVDLALRRAISLTVAEALAVLLQTWNKNFYRFGNTFDEQHFADIERLLQRYKKPLAAYRQQKIEDLDLNDKPKVVKMFQEFETTLGPVGSAKALHLLAPALFPIWDTAIAQKTGRRLGRLGTNGNRYWDFMRLTRDQCLDLRRQGGKGNFLKRIDEYHYCRYTRKLSQFQKE